MVWLDQSQFDAFAAAGTNAHRLGSSSGGWAERLAEDVLLSYKSESTLADLLTGMEAYCATSGWNPARVFTRFMPTQNADRVSPELRSGDATLPLTTTVTETRIRYGLDFGAGYSHGLFLDQRLNRAKIQALRPKRLLNTFAYTCSFSVVAAQVGAETLSVDLSRKSLERGKQNLALNDLPAAGHRFVVDDTLELLPKLATRGERFDAIILDPPTFSRSANGRRWQAEHDYEELINGAIDVAATKCAVLLSTNCTKLDVMALEKMARLCIKTKRRAADYLKLGTPIDFPPGHGASALWMMVR